MQREFKLVIDVEEILENQMYEVALEAGQRAAEVLDATVDNWYLELHDDQRLIRAWESKRDDSNDNLHRDEVP